MICHTISLFFGVSVAQRLELMSKEPTANSCVKCSLSGLGCSRVLRGAIDDLAVQIDSVGSRERDAPGKSYSRTRSARVRHD